jgi:hypothetical protein
MTSESSEKKRIRVKYSKKYISLIIILFLSTVLILTVGILLSRRRDDITPTDQKTQEEEDVIRTHEEFKGAVVEVGNNTITVVPDGIPDYVSNQILCSVDKDSEMSVEVENGILLEEPKEIDFNQIKQYDSGTFSIDKEERGTLISIYCSKIVLQIFGESE